MNTKTSRLLILILAATAALSGCNLPFGQTPVKPLLPPTQELNLLATLTQQAIELDVQETLTAPTFTISPTPTETPQPADTILPTEVSLPAGNPEIKFYPGGTIAYLKGKIRAGEKISYTLEAGQGQTLIVSVSSESNQATFEIRDPEDGEILVPFSDETSSARLTLPWSGVYQITLTSPETLDYFLSIEVPANLVVSPGLGASVVSGTVNVYQSFHPAVFTRVRYLMQLQAGSILDVQLSSPSLKDLALALIGADDGQPYLRHEVQSGAIKGLVIHETQGYYLDVYSISGQSAAFSLTIKVE